MQVSVVADSYRLRDADKICRIRRVSIDSVMRGNIAEIRSCDGYSIRMVKPL